MSHVESFTAGAPIGASDRVAVLPAVDQAQQTIEPRMLWSLAV
jgi:hypothetical protein